MKLSDHFCYLNFSEYVAEKHNPHNLVAAFPKDYAHKGHFQRLYDPRLKYLIKEFADDSGHTAAEFYTNRTVVKLMTMIMDPQPGESVYDPTCGSGGLLLNCALHLKDEGKEYRTLKLYGQEINLLTSAIARMNMFFQVFISITQFIIRDSAYIKLVL
jgi:type I restriction-modification system DNA methylase subunit